MVEVVVALDLPSADDALHLVDRLPGLRWVKVGPMLFLDGGPRVIHELKERGIRLFLDLKWYDIPHSVEGAVRAAAGLGVDLATVHTVGGREMMEAAVRATGPSLQLVGVTVLTSHTPESYGKAVGNAPRAGLELEVLRLARAAIEAGLRGVVASAYEITRVREVVGSDAWIVVPGIRPRGAESGDQRRTADALTAARAGATHLVVGRPVIQARDPRSVYEELCASVA